jgi:CRISPR/Cas system-associated exonuclease Cas4 (RecB family)
LQAMVKKSVQGVFASKFHPGQRQMAGLQDDNAIAQAVMTKLVSRVLVLDQAYAPFVLIGLEMGRQVSLHLDFELNAAMHVRLKGIIDRVDWKAGVFRVLDYKTGLDEKKIKSVSSLFDRAATRRSKAAFQTLFYAWLFQQQRLPYVATVSLASGHSTSPSGEVKIMPGLLNTRQLFDDHFDPRFFLQQPSGRTYLPIENITAFRAEWEQGLHQTLTELLDPSVPFVQTTDEARCVSCPYKGICQRH